eukprot:CFRG1104T1
MDFLLENGGVGLLDVRESENFAIEHVRGSTSFPWSERNMHFFQLPPRKIPLHVMCPTSLREQVTSELAEKGWKIDTLILHDEIDWTAAREANLCETGTHSEFIFKPCPFFESLFENVKKCFSSLDRPVRMLDLGCGTGRDSLWATRHGWTSTAVDNVGWRLKLLKEVANRHGLNINTVTADVLKADGQKKLKDLGQFDVVLCVRFFVRDFLAEIPSLIRPGGVIMIQHFRDGVQNSAVGRPKKLKFIVGTDELPQFFCEKSDYELIYNKLTYLEEDGRPVVNFAARKPTEAEIEENLIRRQKLYAESAAKDSQNCISTSDGVKNVSN